MRLIDLEGLEVGSLLVVERDHSKKIASWLCLCVCGNISSVQGNHLREQKVVSCGKGECHVSRRSAACQPEDLSGRKFNMLRAVQLGPAYVSPTGKKTARWWCECECGRLCLKRAAKLKSGATKSCGCLNNQMGTADLDGLDWSPNSVGVVEQYAPGQNGRVKDPGYAWRSNDTSLPRKW